MRNIWNIYRRECASYFNSPIAYIAILVFLAIMSFLYFFFPVPFFGRPNPSFRPFFEERFPFAFFSFVFIPCVTMRH